MAICEAHHPTSVEGCFRCKIIRVDFAPSSMPNRHIGAVKTNALDKQREADLPAYARLVKQGVQPPSTVGAAALEKGASTKIEVEMGKVFGDKMANRVERVQGEITDAMKPYKKTKPDQ